MEWRLGGVEQNGRRKRGNERERGSAWLVMSCKISAVAFPELILRSLPDTEFEPAATTARQTPMKAKTEERAILAVEKRK